MSATRKSPVSDIDESKLKVSTPRKAAAGLEAVAVAFKRGVEQAGPARTIRSMFRINQNEGFDCPGCAWPEPQGRRSPAEFCENGAKAFAEENTTRVADREFWAQNSIKDLSLIHISEPTRPY